MLRPEPLISFKRFSEILWLWYHFSGLRFIWEIINPPTHESKTDNNYRAPATFPLWVIGFYVAFFGVASQNYENRVDVIENRRNAVLTLLVKDETGKSAIRNVPIVQRMVCPQEPNHLDLVLTFKSLFGKPQTHVDTVDLLKGVMVDFKSELSEADLHKANLREANLEEARLERSSLTGACLAGANLKGTDLALADIRGIRDIPIERLCKVKSLYEAKLNPELEKQINENCPHLFEAPSD